MCDLLKKTPSFRVKGSEQLQIHFTKKTTEGEIIMKKTLRTTAAVLAAIAAMSCTTFASFADITPDTVIGSTFADEPIAGGWSVNDGKNLSLSAAPEAKAAFKKATTGLAGVSYKPIALLGTQVVAGTNYAVLCRSTVVYPDAQPEIKIMYIYEDLEGNAQIMGFQTIIGEQLMGGFTANSGKLAFGKNKSVKRIYKNAMKGLTGVSYSPVAYLGSQIVAGTNYMVLCRSKVVYPGTPYKWSLVTVNKDLDGKASLVDIETLELGSMDDDAANEENDDIMVGIANPWSEYKTVAEAAKAAGVEFSAPDKIGEYKLTYIQAMKGIVDVRYKKGEDEICIRKGKGTDDISGDYNTYKNVRDIKTGEYTVTLKGNGKGVNCAVWNDGKNAYSVCSDREISEKSLESIITKIS